MTNDELFCTVIIAVKQQPWAYGESGKESQRVKAKEDPDDNMLVRQEVMCQDEAGIINPINCSGGAKKKLLHVKARPKRSLKPETARVDFP